MTSPRLFSAVGALGLAACASLHSVGLTPKSADVPASRALEGLEDRARSVRSLRGFGSLEIDDGTKRVSVRVALILRRPDELRVEFLSAFGVALLVTTDGEALYAYDVRENAFFEAEATEENLERLTKIPLKLREIVALFAGLATDPKGQRRRFGDASWEPATGLWRVSSRGDASTSVWVRDGRGVPSRVLRADPSGEAIVDARFEDLVVVDGTSMPSLIIVQTYDPPARIELRYSELELNVPVEESLFRIESPRDAS